MKFLTKPPYILSNDDNNKRCKYHSADEDNDDVIESF